MTEKILTKQLKQVSTDVNLGNSDSLLPTQKAVKTYVDTEISKSTDKHNMGYYETPTALRTAHPTAEAGDWAIVNSTDTVWLWDTDTSDWVDSDQKGQVTSVNSKTGAVVLIPSDIGAATSAQGTKADTALQPNDNVSELVNDAGYLTQHQTLVDLGITANATEINVLDGITASTAELNYVDGVTSDIQTQLNNKQATLVSGTNIKTINSDSLLGSGNIDVLVNEATPASSLGIGYTTINTTYTDSINIGNGAQVGANNALALGAFASAEGQDSIAIYSSTGTAHRARTTHTGNIAIGYNALAINAAYTIAIGYNAFAQGANSIQLGTGNVSSQNTFQVWTHKLLDKTTGLIPSARFADQTSATQGQALILDSNLDGQWTTIATVATSGSYDDLLNKPTIPAAQVNSDWDALSGVAQILNKPTIPTVNDATINVTQNGVSVGSFTLNQASGDTIALTDTTYSVMTGATAGDAGASGLVPAPAAGDQGKFLQGDGTWANPSIGDIDCGTLS